MKKRFSEAQIIGFLGRPRPAYPSSSSAAAMGSPRRVTTCPSRIRCQAATGSWTKSRQWETERTLFSSARATHVSAGEGQQRVALQRRVPAYLVVVGQTPGATQRCLNPGCSERIGNSRRTGSSPADAIRHCSAEGGHPIQDLTAEDDLTPLPSCTPDSPAQLDSGREGHRR